MRRDPTAKYTTRIPAQEDVAFNVRAIEPSRLLKYYYIMYSICIFKLVNCFATSRRYTRCNILNKYILTFAEAHIFM